MGRVVRLGFSLQDSEYKGQLHVSRKPARLSSNESTFFRIEPDALSTHIESQLRIEGGGVRQLLIDLPEATGTDLRFVLSPNSLASPSNDPRKSGIPFPPKIVEQTATPARNGIRRWTLRLDRYATETCLLSVNIRNSRPEKGPFNCPVMSIVGAERETGFVAIEASQEQFLSPLATDVTGQPLLKVDPIDFPPATYSPKEPVVAGFRYTRPGWVLAVGEQRFERTQVPTAVGHSASYKTVYGRNGELQHQADLEFTAVGIQNLKVQLSAEVELWAVQMDGQPQEIRKQEGGLLIAVPQDGQTERHHTLTLFSRSSSTASSLEEFRQVPPAFTVLDGQGAEQPLNILKQSWNLFHPNNLLLIDSPGAFQPTRDLDQDGSLGQWSSMLRAPSPTQIRDAVLLVAIVFLMVWGLQKTVVRFGWVRSLCGAVVIGIPLSMLMLSSRNLDQQMAAQHNAAPATESDFSSVTRVSRQIATEEAPAAEAPMAAPSEMAASAPAQKSTKPKGSEPFENNMPQKQNGKQEDLGIAKDQVEELERLNEASQDSFTQNGNGGDGPPKMLPPESESKPPQSPALVTDSDQPQSDKELQLGDQLGGVPLSGDGEKHVPASPQAKLGGLLSLALTLVAPDDSTSREFTFHGNGSASTDLHLKFISRDKSRDWTAFVMASVIVAGWFSRKLPWALRASLIALLILGSIAVAPLLPNRCQPIIDGLFFGGWGLLIQISVCYLLNRIKSRCCLDIASCSRKPMSTVALLFVLCLAPALGLGPRQSRLRSPPPWSKTCMWCFRTLETIPRPLIASTFPEPLFLQLWKQAHPDEVRPSDAPLDGWSSNLYMRRASNKRAITRSCM